MEQPSLGGSAKARLLYLRGLRPERDVRDTRSCQFESAHTVQHAVHIRAWNLAYACPYRDVLLHPSTCRPTRKSNMSSLTWMVRSPNRAAKV